ncbi:MAG TPA: 2OG-Fe(II) oxygenase [Thermoanaerobaculia bacterium]
MPPAAGLLASLHELERLLEAEEVDLAALGRLAEPMRLEHLFQVQLATLVRRGPSSLTPRRLLAAAAEAAAAGVLPLSAPGALRATLDELETRLYDAGAWDPDTALWWSPLPPPTRPESLWDGLRGDGEPALPTRDELVAAFGGPRLDGPQWLRLPSFLSSALTEAIRSELDDAGLELEPGGVGAEGRRTARRSDEVRYVDGFEPRLLAAAPTLAALVQWAFARLSGGLRVGERRVYPPQSAMLARYPAPSGGYAAHLDNPGGEHDNGRALTLVIYLNAPGHECAGGELALWAPGTSTAGPPAAVLAPRSGSAVLFDSRAAAHQVAALAPGPARWALTLWLNDAPQRPASLPAPRLGPGEALLPIAAPPLPAGTVLFHELDDTRPSGTIEVRKRPPGGKQRVGIVATVYREGRRLDAWCEHHFALGVDHLVLVFDDLEDPQETADARRLRDRYDAGRLTIWPGFLTAGRWPRAPELNELRHFAVLRASSYGVSSRQTLNACVALAAARKGELGGAPLDWLLHLDADELFYLEGSGRGGATLEEHFAAASAAGLALLRYVNHEILHPTSPEPRFKINPRLAAARLGPGGWREMVAHLAMAQTDPRPWFHGYFNGKSAVAVAAGAAAAGVHGWFLEPSWGPETRRFLAGPCVLHFHFSSPESFRRKYLAIAAAPTPAEGGPFELSPVEMATVELIRELERNRTDQETTARLLDEHHRRLTCFSEEEVELLEEAGLLMHPRLPPVDVFDIE